MKLTTSVMFFLVLMSATTGFADAAGIWEDWGVEVDLGVQDEVDNTQDAFSNIDPTNLGASTLISIFLVALNTVKTGFAIVTSLPEMLQIIGVPSFIADMFNIIIPILVGKAALEVYTGRGL